MNNCLMPADMCTLAFAYKKGETIIAKLPEGAVKPGDKVELVEGGTVLVKETINLIDGGPAYTAISKACTIYTANGVLEYTWRRCDNAS